MVRVLALIGLFLSIEVLVLIAWLVSIAWLVLIALNAKQLPRVKRKATTMISLFLNAERMIIFSLTRPATLARAILT